MQRGLFFSFNSSDRILISLRISAVPVDPSAEIVLLKSLENSPWNYSKPRKMAGVCDVLSE